MALQASGPISFSQISNEFGLPSGKNLGAYRISQTVGDLTRPLDDGIPTSGPIGFGSFYSKSLNVVVYCSGNRVTARSRYTDNDNVTVIGGYKTRPTSSSGTKVWIYTNETIGSNIPASSAPNRQYCSLITGGWDDNTDLRLDIGTSGVVSGAGGNGGAGGGGGGGIRGGNGLFGTSAIGVNHQPIIITNRGKIEGGTGGGGGGGSASTRNRNRNGSSNFFRAGGGGGGGGKGSPGGSGGALGDINTTGWTAGTQSDGTAGTSGGINSGGSGGPGGLVPDKCSGGGGGNHQQAGGGGSGNESAAGGGSAGASGFGIIITNDGTGVTISGNARVGGDAFNTAVS
jgi:hypothetical protein